MTDPRPSVEALDPRLVALPDPDPGEAEEPIEADGATRRANALFGPREVDYRPGGSAEGQRGWLR